MSKSSPKNDPCERGGDDQKVRGNESTARDMGGSAYAGQHLHLRSGSSKQDGWIVSCSCCFRKKI